MDINKATNPMSEYLLKLQLIVSNSEFKNESEARQYETLETQLEGEAYVRAVTHTDSFTSYTYPDTLIYRVLNDFGYPEDRIMYLVKNPVMMPQRCKDMLQLIGRQNFLSAYKERNKYYLTLTGQPSDDTGFVMIPDEFYDIYASDNMLHRGMAIHEMPYKYQELFINSDYYKTILEQHPTLEYLKYLGSYSIPLEVSRPAKDGEIMHINTNKLSTYHKVFGNVTVEPELIHLFKNTYDKVRDYVYNTLRGNFSDIYENYDSFIRFLTIYLSIGNTLNECSKNATSMSYMNSVSANNYFMLYGLPSSIMDGNNMINFLKKFRMILKDKGTNTVYRVKDLVGYEYTDVYSLIMVKQPLFIDGVPVYSVDENGDKQQKFKIVFRRSGVADENTSYFKFREERKEYSLEEITSGDPRWWDGPEVTQMINDMNYTLSNSKYIQLSTHMSMEDIFWETSILLRGLLDRKQETAYSKISINFSVDGSSTMSVFDAVIILVTLMDWKLVDANGRSIKGEMYLPNGVDHNGYPVCLDMLFNGLNDDGSPKEFKEGLPFKITSFNFDIRESDRTFYDAMSSMSYLDESFLSLVDKVLDMENNNVGEVLMYDIKSIYKYLVNKLLESKTIYEFRQITDVYSHLFLVDPIRNWYSDTPYDPNAIICEEFQITNNELSMFENTFIEDHSDFEVTYNNMSYPISIYNIMNYNVPDIKINDEYPFTNDSFLEEFYKALDSYTSIEVATSESLSPIIKSRYKDIIKSKVILDTGNSSDGPKTFEAMLFRSNPSLYSRLVDLRKDDNSMNMLIRSIINGLESYTNSSLAGLQFKSLGNDEYFKTLKEVISYFKSYMVEYTKDEFVYLFGGIFDNGGNSDMLRLYDQVDHIRIRMVPKDSLTLFDVSKWKKKLKLPDDNSMMMHDEALFRLKGKYSKIKSSGYEIWYDDGSWISTNPLPALIDDSIIVANVVPHNNTYRIIINIENIIS